MPNNLWHKKLGKIFILRFFFEERIRPESLTDVQTNKSTADHDLKMYENKDISNVMIDELSRALFRQLNKKR